MEKNDFRLDILLEELQKGYVPKWEIGIIIWSIEHMCPLNSDMNKGGVASSRFNGETQVLYLSTYKWAHEKK